MLRTRLLVCLATPSLKSILLFVDYAAQWVSCAPCICLLKIDFLVLVKIILNSQLEKFSVFRFPFSVSFHIFVVMKQFFALLKGWAQSLRKYISPVFLALLAVSFTLWYISKLNYTYTTDFNIKVKVEGQRIVVPCVVEGKGTNLFGYGFYTSRRVNIPLSELNHEVVELPVVNEQGVVDTLAKSYKVRISPLSMQDAISVRFSDLKIVSVGHFNDLEITQE